MFFRFVRQISSEGLFRGWIDLFIYISTMDDQDMKNADAQADIAGKNANEAGKIAGKADESAAAAHEKRAAEENEKSNP